MNVKLESVHISRISVGDTIERDGKLTTISGNNLKVNTFMGTTLFGDSYKLGSVAVNKVVAWIGADGSLIPLRR